MSNTVTVEKPVVKKKIAELTQDEKISSFLRASFPVTEGHRLIVAHLWANHYRLNFYHLQKMVIDQSHFVTVRTDDEGGFSVSIRGEEKQKKS